MKTDSITFKTKKSLSEIVNILRIASSKLKADIDKIEDDPFGNIGGKAPEIAIALTGSNILGVGPRGWCIQVYVTNLGSERSVEIVALGDSVLHQMSGAPFFELTLGKKQRDKLAKMLL